jgi:clan AA aspartic protease
LLSGNSKKLCIFAEKFNLSPLIFIVMGVVHVEIMLENAADVAKARDGFIQEQAIRQTTITAMVDTGAITLVIDDATYEKLGLTTKSSRRTTLADGSKQSCKLTEPVEVHWKNRSTSCEAIVLPNSGQVLLGAIPLEGMDLMVNPVEQALVGIHGDEPLCIVMKA